MLFRVSMLDETVETRRPWRGFPCPAIHGRAFLCIVCIIQQYLGSFAIRSRERACPSRSQGMKSLTLWQKRKKCDDKALPLCYNQLKALYFCKRHHITIFTGAHHFEEGRPLRIFRQRHGNFRCFMLPVNSRKIEMSDVETLREKRVVGILPAFI